MEVSGQLHALAALYPGKSPLVPNWIGGWVVPQSRCGEEKNLASTGNPTLAVHSVDRGYTDRAKTIQKLQTSLQPRILVPCNITVKTSTFSNNTKASPAPCVSGTLRGAERAELHS
jgi:hypothetical protein